MPALMPQTYQDAPEPAGQASDKPRGRKPRNAPAWSGGLEGYGDLMVRSRAACGNRAGRAQSVIARMSDGAEARPDSWRTQQARNAVTAARGQAVRYRRGPTKSGRPLGATDAGDHAGARKVGGARIGLPRAKVSTMLIAAPQCGHTKVGWTMPTGASSGDGGSAAAGTTFSSWRARARCSRRPVFAIRP